MTSFLLVRISVPANPVSGPSGFTKHGNAISLALNLLPFSGIAFLWFMAVLRERVGELEDRFFVTVFLGSGFFFVAMVFTPGAVAGGIITILSHASPSLIQSGGYALGRAEAYQTLNIYAAKMAGVFMMATCIISLRTRILPRWMPFLGYALLLSRHLGRCSSSPAERLNDTSGKSAPPSSREGGVRWEERYGS
jgi:hypothetical protein